MPAPTITSPYAGYGGYSGGGTVAGSAMNGMANMISAKGNYNLSTSAAAINMTQARKKPYSEPTTGGQYVLRDAGRQSGGAGRRTRSQPDHGTTDQNRQGRRAQDRWGRAKWIPSTANSTGPAPYSKTAFESQRHEVDQLFVVRARYGGLGYADQMKVRETVDAMFAQLKEQIQQIPPQDYVACRSFLQSVGYAATKTELE